MSSKKTTEKKKESDDKNIVNLKKEIEKLKQELNEKNDKLLRSYADFQNYQKRVEKEIAFKEEEIRKKYLLEIIDLFELLQKAYENNNPKEGIKAILQNIKHLLDIEQVRVIDCLGKTFDHNCHYAVSVVEKNDCPDGLIVEEIKRGYKLGEKILRPSQVVVSKKIINKKEEE
ncbi:MAG: nucleotide exchange factor GrpE [Candidatus Thermoplasmatota archaeon]|jgi:molecular chaperone GrpE|nr:nucleotide exchange factor GrpE [Candidatus Thermoplasmatota archaeon]